jgi:hypothetical protein
MKEHRVHARGVVTVAAFLVMSTILAQGPAAASDPPDQVLAWNAIASDELIARMPAPWNAPVVAGLHLAIVHGAVYDAVNAIDGGYRPYLGAPTGADLSDSEDAAAVAAADATLRYLLAPPLIPAGDDPTTEEDVAGVTLRLNARYAASLQAILDAGVSQTSIDGGVAVGQAAAARMIAERTGDGRYALPWTFDEGSDAGEWRALTPGANNYRWAGRTDPFLVPNAAMFATAGPNELTSAKYTTEFNQVKSLGASDSTTRTLDQTKMAWFWADHAIAMWNRIFRQLSENNHLSTTDNARYFGMLFLTAADAIIACQQDKATYLFWRPTTAIQEAAADRNPDTTPRADWVALVPVPPYPEHPSGHNCGSSAIVETLKDFWGTNRMSFSATRATSPVGTITRYYTKFSEAMTEIRLARVYGGLHFMTADAQGATLGREVATYREAHYFQPVI